MDYQKFLAGLPELYSDWGKESVQTRSTHFQQALTQIKGMTTANVMQLLNWAVACMEDHEIYCEVGTYRGSTLIGAMLNQSGRIAYAVDNFSEFDAKGENLAQLETNLATFNLQHQVVFHNQDFEEFLQDCNQKVGVYFYDGAHDYRSQLMGLLLARPLLADGAVIVIDDSNSPTVKQGIWDFIAAHPNCEPLLELTTPIARHPSFWNGIQVLGWNISETDRSNRKLPRYPIVLQSIYELHVLESKYTDAKNFLAQGQLVFTIALAEQCLLINPHFMPVHEVLGQAFQAQGELDRAIAAYNRAVELNPQSVSVATYNQLGIALAAQGKFDRAITAFRQALDIQPDYIDAHYNLGIALAETGELDAAIECFQTTINYQPDYINAWLNLAALQSQQSRLEEASDCYEQVMELQPEDAEIAYLLAVTLRQQGRLEESIEIYRKVAELRLAYANSNYDPSLVLNEANAIDRAFEYHQRSLEIEAEFADVYVELGHQLLQQELFEPAIEAYQTAIEIYPDCAEAFLNLGGIAYKRDQFNESIDYFQTAIEIQPDYVEAYCNLGNAVAQQYQFEEAIACYEKALALQPDLPDIRKRLSRIYVRMVPRWHFAMMNDEYRNDCYDRALKKVVQSESDVLDIGSGSGLLAMMAARAGAKHVTTCEKVKPVADMARQIVARNGFADRISVINKMSSELEIGIDMTSKADILVSEIFDVGLLAEGAIPAFKHARQHLLQPNAKILPQSATVYAVLVESQRLYDEDRVAIASGFDVSQFNTFSSTPTYLQNYLNAFPYRLLSEVFEVFSFDFYQDIRSQQTEIKIDIVNNGKVHAFVFWFRLWLDDEIFIDTGAQSQETCWMQAIQLLDAPVSVTQGDIIKSIAKHDCSYISFELIADS